MSSLAVHPRRENQADAIVIDIEQQVRSSTGIGELPEPQEEITVRQRHSIGFITIAKTLLVSRVESCFTV